MANSKGDYTDDYPKVHISSTDIKLEGLNGKTVRFQTVSAGSGDNSRGKLIAQVDDAHGMSKGAVINFDHLWEILKSVIEMEVDKRFDPADWDARYDAGVPVGVTFGGEKAVNKLSPREFAKEKSTEILKNQSSIVSALEEQQKKPFVLKAVRSKNFRK